MRCRTVYENFIDVCDGVAGVDDALDSLRRALDTFDNVVADCGDSSGSGGDIVSRDDCSAAIQDLSNCTNVVVCTCMFSYTGDHLLLFCKCRPLTLPQHCVLGCSAGQYMTMSLMYVLVSLVLTLHWMLYDKH